MKVLVYFWIISFLLLLGEFGFLKWRKNKLFSKVAMNSMIYGFSQGQKVNDICQVKLNGQRITHDQIRVNFFCQSRRWGSVAFPYSTVKEEKFANLFKEINRLVYDTGGLKIEDWVCKNERGEILKEEANLNGSHSLICSEK